MVLDAWGDSSSVMFDRELWSELTTLRFLEDANNVLIMGPVGVGKTFMASALGNIVCRRRNSVPMLRADRMLKRLKAGRLDATHEAELRKLRRVDLLIVEDFDLHQLDPTENSRRLRHRGGRASPRRNDRDLESLTGGMADDDRGPVARTKRDRPSRAQPMSSSSKATHTGASKTAEEECAMMHQSAWRQRLPARSRWREVVPCW